LENVRNFRIAVYLGLTEDEPIGRIAHVVDGMLLQVYDFVETLFRDGYDH